MLDGVQKHSIGNLYRWLTCGNINRAKPWKYKTLLKYWLYDAEESKNYVHIFGSWCLWFWCFVQVRILLVLPANQVINCNLYSISDEITGIIQQIYVKDMQSAPITDYLTHLSLGKMNGHHFADNIFKWIFMNEKLCILNQISLKFFCKGPIENKTALVWVMSWHQTGDKPLPEPMLTCFTDTCSTRARWVNQ